MKLNKFKKVLVVLIILAISLISFIGIYVKKGNIFENVIPEYKLGMNLSGARNIKLSVGSHINEVIYDEEGNIATDGENEDGTLKEGYTKKEVPENLEEDKTLSNYQISKKIIQDRLKKIGVTEYIVRQNIDTGEMMIEIPENIETDEVVANLPYVGKLQVIDTDTEEVLMDNKDVKESKAVYSTTDSGTTVYLSIEFNKDGKKKLEDISNKYVKTTDEHGEEITKEIKLELDGEALIETYFGEKLSNGILQLSIGSISTSSEQVSSYMKQASTIATLIDCGKMPLEYEVTHNTYLKTSTNENTLKIISSIIAGLVILGIIYIIIKYKGNGFFAGISFIGLIALILLIVRITNVTVSFESIVGIITILIAEYILLMHVLKQLNNINLPKKQIIKETYIRFGSILFPLLIIAIVFTFTHWLPIASVGMLLFWELLILFIYNYVCIQLLLEPKQSKTKINKEA